MRTARDVASPHVYWVFDLIEIDGQELVAMEYVDGTTLEHCCERGVRSTWSRRAALPRSS